MPVPIYRSVCEYLPDHLQSHAYVVYCVMIRLLQIENKSSRMCAVQFANYENAKPMAIEIGILYVLLNMT